VNVAWESAFLGIGRRPTFASRTIKRQFLGRITLRYRSASTHGANAISVRAVSPFFKLVFIVFSCCNKNWPTPDEAGQARSHWQRTRFIRASKIFYARDEPLCRSERPSLRQF
jgi:hypothetical protein